jgi:hypothetical protein
VSALGVVELERPGQCLEHALRDTVLCLRAPGGVVGNAHAGQDDDLLAAPDSFPTHSGTRASRTSASPHQASSAGDDPASSAGLASSASSCPGSGAPSTRARSAGAPG